LVNTELRDFMSVLWRMTLSLVLLAVFVLGEWFIAWLVGVTLMSGNPNPFQEPPLSWAKTLSLWGIALIWGIHVLAESLLWIGRHLPVGYSKAISRGRGE